MTKPYLQIHDLSDWHPGVTAGLSASYAEAARVCLDRHHASPIEFVVDRGETSIEAIAEWTAADDRTRKAWANETDATESGAYCMGLAAIEITDGLVAVARAETKTGADYYLAQAGASLGDLERSSRLEVSGVDGGGLSALRARLRQKVNQAVAGKSSLPAIAAIVGFSAKLLLVADVQLE